MVYTILFATGAVRAIVSVHLWFNPRQGHTKDIKNGTTVLCHCSYSELCVYIFLDPCVPVQSPDLAMIQQRIKEVLQVLGDFNARREEGRY